MRNKAGIAAAGIIIASLMLTSCAQSSIKQSSIKQSSIKKISSTEPSAVNTSETVSGTSAAAQNPEPLPEGTIPPDYLNGEEGPSLYDVSPIAEAYKSGDRTGLDDIQNAILDKAEQIIAEIITDGMTDYEKELAVHDYIVENCTYDLGAKAVIPHPGEHCEDPYGALIDGKAICKGYTTAFRMFMEMFDIPCETVYYRHPTEPQHDHAWNVVTLDGSPYYVDVTWDDPVPDNTPRLTRHGFFNMSYDMLCVEHKPPEDCPRTTVFTETHASHELSPQPSSKEDIAELVAAAVEKNSDAIYFIPEEGSDWEADLPKQDKFTVIDDDTLRLRVAQGCNLAGCYLTAGGYADTDKGRAVYFRFRTHY